MGTDDIPHGYRVSALRVLMIFLMGTVDLLTGTDDIPLRHGYHGSALRVLMILFTGTMDLFYGY